MRTKYFIRIIKYFILSALLAFTFTSCSDGGSSSPQNNNEFTAIIPETTKVLDEDSLSNLESVSEDKKTLTFSSQTDFLSTIKAGDILVIPASTLTPDGLLRKVTSISTENGKVIIETEQATLTEAIEQGSIYFSQQLTADDIEKVTTLHDGITSSTGTVSTMTVKKTSSGKIGINIEDHIAPGIKFKGSTGLSFTPTLDIKIKWFSLKKLTAKAEASEDANISVTAEHSFFAFKKEKKIGEIEFKSFVIYVGYVPVYIKPVIEVHIGVKGRSTAELTTGIFQSLSYAAGIEYDGNWNVINQIDKTFEGKPPTLDANATVKGYITPKFVFYIYGTGGPYGGVEGYLKLVADINKDPWCDLLAGIAGSVGITGQILSINLGDVSLELAKAETSLYNCKKPYMLVESVSGLGTSGPEGGPFNPSSITYTIKGKDGSIDWTASTNVNWLDLSMTQGTVDETNTNDVVVSLNNNVNSLPKGTYIGTITFTNTTNGEGNTVRLVVLSVREKSMAVTPGPDSYFLGSAPEGGDFTGLSKVTFTITSDAGTIDWEVQKTANWLTVTPSSGSVTEGSPVTVEVAVDSSVAQTLPAKTQIEYLQFINKTNGKGNTTRTILIQPLMNVTPTSFSVSGPEGGPFSGEQTFQIQAINADIPWKVTSSESWLKISDTSGTAPAGSSSSITVSIDSDVASTLPQGTHTAELIFTNTNSGVMSDETVVPVTLTVKEPLTVTPSQVSFSGAEGGPFNPSSASFTVESESDVSFEVSSDANWLDINPTSGNVSPSSPATVNVSVNSNADSLTKGTYTATLTFTKNPGNKSVTTNVVLYVGSGAKITWLGVLPGGTRSYARDVSDDGFVVVGASTDNNGNLHAFRWTASDGMQDLGSLGGSYSDAYAVSADGSVIVGLAEDNNGNLHAFRWTASGGMQDLGTLGGSDSYAYDVSADGSVIVGMAEDSNFIGTAFIWTSTTGMQSLGTLLPNPSIAGTFSEAKAVSADGSVVVGWTYNSNGDIHAFRWTASTGMQDLGTLGGSRSQATAVSDDGSVVVGWAQTSTTNQHAFRWTASGGMQDLGDLGGGYSEAYDVSADGSVIVGVTRDANSYLQPFRWTQTGGLENLNETYSDLLPCVLDPSDGISYCSNLDWATAISPDGRFIVGPGVNGETKRSEAFLLDTGVGQ